MPECIIDPTTQVRTSVKNTKQSSVEKPEVPTVVIFEKTSFGIYINTIT